ncbi:Hsp20/alpha crystallin family protein [Patescibacteria group bacterium]|nr:Hsp20/alpha crystallin family protein [Patescibacteria group bacterium]MCH8889257.1 Hsp20/alpha crystallin family protein [Patescibacteria group bacterium]
MAKGGRSFFERLTGTVNVDDSEEEALDEREVSQVASDDVLDESVSEDSIEENDEEGQLIVDVYNTPDEIVIKAIVAGVKPDNLDISITRDMVTIRGKREEKREIREEDYFYQELYWGAFSRTILLPQEVEVGHAMANEKHGLLTIRLPKIDKEKQTKLKVRGS